MQTFTRKIEKIESVQAIQFTGNYDQVPEIVKIFNANHVSMELSGEHIQALRVSKDKGFNQRVIKPTDYVVAEPQVGDDTKVTVQTAVEFEFKFGTDEQKHQAHKAMIDKLLTDYVQNRSILVRYKGEYDIDYQVKDAAFFARTLLHCNPNAYDQPWENTNTTKPIAKYVNDTIVKYLDCNEKLHIDGSTNHTMEDPQWIWPNNKRYQA